MYATIVATLAMVGATGPVVERKEAPAGMATIKRLMEACPRPDPATPDKTIATQRARLEALVKYLEKTHARYESGSVEPAVFFNLLQVQRDMISTGADLAPLPEEALCWQRVGLDLAKGAYKFSEVMVHNGVWPASHRDQAAAQVELFQTQYREALTRCLLLSK
jgi:hypothetical protein